VGPLCMHVLTFLCRESAAATFLLPGYQHDHIINPLPPPQGKVLSTTVVPSGYHHSCLKVLVSSTHAYAAT